VVRPKGVVGALAGGSPLRKSRGEGEDVPDGAVGQYDSTRVAGPPHRVSKVADEVPRAVHVGDDRRARLEVDLDGLPAFAGAGAVDLDAVIELVDG
jgi:hypothetical protein